MNKTLHQDVIAGFVLLVITTIFYVKTVDLPEKAALFPEFILWLLLFFSVAIIINGIIKTNKAKKGEQVSKTEEEERLTFSMIKKPLLFIVILAGYFAIMNYLGFFVTTSLLIALILYILNCRKVVTYIFTILGTSLFIYFLFVSLLNVNLPQGIFL